MKRQKRGIYREIPLPSSLINDIQVYKENIKESIEGQGRLWSFSLRRASRRVKRVINMAQVEGPHATAKGLRHGFAVNAVSKVPLTLVKKWLGHSNLETTEIYLEIAGREERKMAQELW